MTVQPRRRWSQIHFSTGIVLMLTASIMVGLNTIEITNPKCQHYCASGETITVTWYRRGMPEIYAQGIRAQKPEHTEYERSSWSTRALIVDILIALAVVVLSGSAFEFLVRTPGWFGRILSRLPRPSRASLYGCAVAALMITLLGAHCIDNLRYNHKHFGWPDDFLWQQGARTDFRSRAFTRDLIWALGTFLACMLAAELWARKLSFRQRWAAGALLAAAVVAAVLWYYGPSSQISECCTYCGMARFTSTRLGITTEQRVQEDECSRWVLGMRPEHTDHKWGAVSGSLRSWFGPTLCFDGCSTVRYVFEVRRRRGEVVGADLLKKYHELLATGDMDQLGSFTRELMRSRNAP
jgi:hypothetical protein